jgi:hypothetical protein
MATPRDKLNETLNSMNEFEVIETLDFIEYLQYKRSKEIKEVLANAPEDDEPLSEEDLQSIEEAENDVREGNTLTFEEVFRRNE